MGKSFYIWVLAYVYLLPNLTLCDIDKNKSLPQNKLSECRRCKVYSDSFNNWLDKTSRGKFEGGDAAWEESKLKSYAQSEVRLVEIQEGLCTDLNKNKDDCYSLAEEAEHLVEIWWSEHNVQSADFYTWLCIDNLKYCCPKNKFGELCTPCPVDNESKICSDHGTCNGEGTRKGDGTCICNTGYSGLHCNQCAKNYFRTNEDECKPCHRACEECFSYGADRCKMCSTGWELKNGRCIDINECSSDTVCKYNQYCVNNEGSYFCKYCDATCLTCTGIGPNNCTSCKQNDILRSGKCLDEKASNVLLSNADKRLFLYISLNILMYIIYQKSKPLAFGMGAAFSIITYKLEYVFDITVKDAIQNHVINFLNTINGLKNL